MEGFWEYSPYIILALIALFIFLAPRLGYESLTDYMIRILTEKVVDLETQLEAANNDARLWRALMSSERIRFLGSAKLGNPEQQHLGLELWAKFPGKTEEIGKEKLIQYVEAIVAAKEKGGG